MSAIESVHKSITRKVIPWIELGRANILVMPCSTNDLPCGVQVEEKPLRGVRRLQKYYRSGGQISVCTALWPEEGLCEKAEPFFCWVLSGQAEMQIGSQLLNCGPTTAILIPAGLPHPDGSRGQAAQNGSEPCSILWIRQCGRGLRVWISQSEKSPNGEDLRSVRQASVYLSQEEIVYLFNLLCEELLDRGRVNEISDHALILFFLLLEKELNARRAFDLMKSQGSRREEWSFDQQQHPIDRACAYIQSHLNTQLTLEKVAEIVHMSRATFARQFREHTGSTFLKYVQKQRIEQAQVFLSETDWTVRTISKLCGFASDSAFSNLFKKVTGKTPLQYRKSTFETGS